MLLCRAIKSADYAMTHSTHTHEWNVALRFSLLLSRMRVRTQVLTVLMLLIFKISKTNYNFLKQKRLYGVLIAGANHSLVLISGSRPRRIFLKVQLCWHFVISSVPGEVFNSLTRKWQVLTTPELMFWSCLGRTFCLIYIFLCRVGIIRKGRQIGRNEQGRILGGFLLWSGLLCRVGIQFISISGSTHKGKPI